MFSMDALDLSNQQVLASSMSDKISQKKPHVLGVCLTSKYIAANNSSMYGQGRIAPNYDAREYFDLYQNREISLPVYKSIQVLKKPQHGSISQYKHLETNSDEWRYLPNVGFVGNDQVEFVVGEGETAVRIIYYFKVSKLNLDDGTVVRKLCKQLEWKISLSDSQDQTDFTNWQTTANLNAMLANASGSLTNFSDLITSPRIPT